MITINKKISIAFLGLLFVAWLSIKPGLAETRGEDADAVLSLMSEAEFRNSYTGEIHIFNLSLAQPRIIQFWVQHLTPNLERRQYSDRPEIFINDGTNIWRYLPNERLIIKRVSPDFKKNIRVIKRNISLIKQNYQVKVRPGSTFLGKYQTLLVEFVPRWKQDRPLRRVWIEAEKGLPLRTEIYSLDQRLSFLSFFSSVNLNERPDSELFILKVPPKTSLQVESQREVEGLEQLNKQLPFQVLFPDYIPPEFSLTGIKIKISREREVHLEFSDGLSILSLFQQVRKKKHTQNYAPAKTVMIDGNEGNLYHFGLINLLEWAEDNLWITLVGELKEEEMLKLANSLRSGYPTSP